MINTTEIPYGRISRRLEADLMEDGVPDYLDSRGDGATPTFTKHPLSVNQGAYEMTVTDGFAFLQFPRVALSQVTEVTVGAAYQADLNDSGRDSVGLVFDESETTESSNRLATFSLLDQDVVRASEVDDGTTESYDTTVPAAGDSATVQELTIRPQEGEYEISIDDQVAYQRDYQTFNDGLWYYPKLQLYTGDTGAEGSVYVHKMWLDISHNSGEMGLVPDSQIHSWTFEEGSGTVAADQVGDADLTLDGATFSTDTALGEHALDTDGTSNLASTTAGDLSISGAFSVELVVRVRSGAFDLVRFFTLTDGSDDTEHVYLWTDDTNTPNVRIFRGSDGDWFDVDNSTSLDSSTFHSVVATVSDGSAVLYVDGFEVGRDENLGSRPDLSNTLFTLANNVNMDRGLDALWSEVNIYNEQLTAEEVYVLSNRI